MTELTKTKVTLDVPWKISDIILTYSLTFATALLTIGILLQMNTGSGSLIYVSVLQASITLTSLICVYYIIVRKYKTSFLKALGIDFKKIGKNFLQGLLVAALVIFATSAISYIFGLFTSSAPVNPYGNYSKEKMEVISMFAILTAPFFEEILFRGFIQPVFVKQGGAFFGIMLASLIFAFSHSQYLNYDSAFVGVFAIGIVLGYTRHLTGSIMPGIFAHLINNLLAVLGLS